MNNNVISGSLVYKGDIGMSAYDLAVQNGYEGSITDWLATLGTSSHFTRESTVYTTTVDNQTEFDLPEGYTSSCFVEVFVAGIKEKDEDVTIDAANEKITLDNAVASTGTEVEVVLLTMSTNSLPISDTITSTSTNDTASGTKSVYDYVENHNFAEDSNYVHTDNNFTDSHKEQLETLMATFDFGTGAYDSSHTYNEGDIVTRGYKIYECKANDTTGTWDSSKWTQITIFVE